jgi:hypothetical protein
MLHANDTQQPEAAPKAKPHHSRTLCCTLEVYASAMRATVWVIAIKWQRNNNQLLPPGTCTTCICQTSAALAVSGPSTSLEMAL